MDYTMMSCILCCTNTRYHKLVWSCHGMEGSGDAPSGMLIGGADNGNVLIWNVDNIIK